MKFHRELACAAVAVASVGLFGCGPGGPGDNPCEGAKPDFQKSACFFDNGTVAVFEQAGANITVGYQGVLDVSGREPILTTYAAAGLCPVNVHWHLGTEHFSLGEFDDFGTGPEVHSQSGGRRGFRCHQYNSTVADFTTEYNWQHCEDMVVGETYEVHWPHSKGGKCNTPWQWQTPFYDGVFCDFAEATTPSTQAAIGVQGQVFTIVNPVNDEEHYYPDLFRGMLMDGDFGKDITYYTGSTTGTSVDNEVCSNYAPITWQVDRKCHLISARSFDKMCSDMKSQSDDLSGDMVAHGSRILVERTLNANNFVFESTAKKLVFTV